MGRLLREELRRRGEGWVSKGDARRRAGWAVDGSAFRAHVVGDSERRVEGVNRVVDVGLDERLALGKRLAQLGDLLLSMARRQARLELAAQRLLGLCYELVARLAPACGLGW